MSLCTDLGPDYRFSNKDWERHWQILNATVFAEPSREMTPAEEEFVGTVELADDLRRKFGFWPNAKAVQEEIEKEYARLSAIADAKEIAWHDKHSVRRSAPR